MNKLDFLMSDSNSLYCSSHVSSVPHAISIDNGINYLVHSFCYSRTVVCKNGIKFAGIIVKHVSVIWNLISFWVLSYEQAQWNNAGTGEELFLFLSIG
jgi:hypothetical protein